MVTKVAELISKSIASMNDGVLVKYFKHLLMIFAYKHREKVKILKECFSSDHTQTIFYNIFGPWGVRTYA